MDLSGLKHFDVAALMSDATGKPLSLPLARIDLDPDNVRTKVDPVALAELVESIRAQGLIQPISVRPNPAKSGHYLVNAGERRLRAYRELARDTIEAFVREQFDPYLQAVENLQREELSAMDLARFVAKREAEGETRASIARKLGKSASFITEAARLAHAPPAILSALDSGRIADTRTAYLLTKAWDHREAAIESLLGTQEVVTRPMAIAIVGSGDTAPAVQSERNCGRRRATKRWGERVADRMPRLGIECEGRRGQLVLEPVDAPDHGWIVLDDGTRRCVALTTIRLVSLG